MESINSITVPELLAPAGSLAHLKAAIHAGADAVYMGGQRFGARAYAENFSEEEVVEALRYAHFYNRRLYLTVNTLVKETEMDSLYEFLKPYYEAGLDGVIVQDLGAAYFIREHFPLMEVHGSTQMTITDVNGALAAKRFGMTRVVPARELSFKEILEIKEETGLEVEVFAHGALCYCYSGQCLLSSTYGDRSGNRGRCAQPCRLAYDLSDEKGKSLVKNKHILSPKDLCGYLALEELTRIGVDSLKIEGRMKNIEYVAGVTKIYREELDRIKEGRKADPKKQARDLKKLEELYCREGFTDGYFNKHNGRHMMAMEYPKNLGRKIGRVTGVQKYQVTINLEEDLVGQDIIVIPLDSQNEIVLTVPQEGTKGRKIIMRLPKGARVHKGMDVYRRRSEELLRMIERDVVTKAPKLLVDGKVILKKGDPAVLTLSCENESVTVTGHVVEPAMKKSIGKEDVLRQLNKTGNVPFAMASCELTLDEGIFYPMSFMKEIRQQAYSLLLEKLERRKDRPNPLAKMDLIGKPEKVSCQKPAEKIATVYSLSQLEKASSFEFFTGFVLPCEFFGQDVLEAAVSLIRGKELKVYLGMPRVYREERRSRKLISQLKDYMAKDFFDGIYVYTIGEAELIEKTLGSKLPMIFAASLYQWNSNALKIYDALWGSHVNELPIELGLEEWNHLVSKNQNHDFEMLVYGRYPVMVSAGCVKENTGRCNQTPEVLYLTDQKKRRLPVSTCCSSCYNLIWKDTPRDLLEDALPASLYSVKRHRFDLFLLTEEEIENMINKYWLWEGCQA